MTPHTELILFITNALFGCIHSLVCLPWKMNGMNIESVLLTSWLLVGCFMLLVNSLAMDAPIWCDISTKLMIGAYIGVPASMVCVLHGLYMAVSAPDSLPDKRLYQLLCKLALMLGIPALIIVIHIIVQDRRYIFIEQAGCIPSISPSLFPLVAVLIWPLLFNVASLAYLGLVMRFIWARRRTQEVTQMLHETTRPRRSLRLFISLFIGIVCTSFVSLSLLLGIINSSDLSINSLHHDFQTVSIVPTAQWLLIPPFRAAIELRWLWTSLNFALSVGLFPKERIDWLFGWLASAKMYVRMRAWHRSASNTACHGSLPVYISRASSSSYGGAPILPPLIRQSTLAPTFSSRVSSVQPHQPGVLPYNPELETRSKISQAGETIEPNVPSEPQGTSQSSEFLSQSPLQSRPVLSPAVSTLTLADSIYPTSSLGGTSSYRTCEEELIRV